MKQGARVQVFLSKQNQFDQALPVWEFEVKPDATRYVLETKEIEISNDCREVIIEIWVEGTGSQSIGKIHISIGDLIQDHLLDPSNPQVGKFIRDDHLLDPSNL